MNTLCEFKLYNYTVYLLIIKFIFIYIDVNIY